MILDLILIILFLIICFIGYKVGFLTTLIKIASAISGLIFAILLTKPVSTILTNANWDASIEGNIYNNITTSDAFALYSAAPNNEEGLSVLIEELGIPNFIAKMISSQIADTVNPLEVANIIADRVSFGVVCVIVFFFLLIFSSLFFFLLKKIVQGTRRAVGFFRFMDGTLGLAFYAIMFLFFLYLGFSILSVVLPVLPPDNEFLIFMKEELHLEDDQFGIAKYLYQNNIIKNFFELIF